MDQNVKQNISDFMTLFKKICPNSDIGQEEQEKAYYTLNLLVAKLKYLLLKHYNISYEAVRLNREYSGQYLHPTNEFNIKIIKNNKVIERVAVGLKKVSFFSLESTIFYAVMQAIENKKLTK